jgi:hypothetical protein
MIYTLKKQWFILILAIGSVLIAGAGLARQEAYAGGNVPVGATSGVCIPEPGKDCSTPPPPPKVPFYQNLSRINVNLDSSNVQVVGGWANAHTVIDGVKILRLTIRTFSKQPYISSNVLTRNYADIVEVDTTKKVAFLATKASDANKGHENGAPRTRTFLTNLNNNNVSALLAINAYTFGKRYGTFSVPSLLLSEGTLGTKCPTGKKCPAFVVKKDGTPGLISAIKDGDDLSSFDIAIGSFPSRGINGLILTNSAPVKNSNDQHPRTAIGVSQDEKKVYLFTVSGRKYDNYSDGMDLRDVARTLHAFGAHNAINMDGGGSTTMAWWEHGKATESTISGEPTGGRPNAVNLAVVRK